jgi:hypothetical protein
MDGLVGHVPQGANRSYGRDQTRILSKSDCSFRHGHAVLYGNEKLPSSSVRFHLSNFFCIFIIFLPDERNTVSHTTELTLSGLWLGCLVG